MDEATILGRLVSVNVGRPRTVEWFGRRVRTAIWKEPLNGPIAVQGVNIDGDDQADRRVHGGADKAVYAYAVEDYRWWAGELGRPVDPATFGENLTTEGVDLAGARIGERWTIGSVTLEVSQPRLPCFKLGLRMGDADFVDQFDEARRFGTYLRIITDGVLEAGQPVIRVRQPDHRLLIADLVQAHHQPDVGLLQRIATVADVPAGWRKMAERALARGH